MLLTNELREFLADLYDCDSRVDIETEGDHIFIRHAWRLDVADAQAKLDQHTEDYNNYLDAQWLRMEQKADQACEDACNF